MQSWDDLFLIGFDLSNNGSAKNYVGDSFQSCKVIPGSPMYYDSLESGWKRISSEIFTVRFKQYKGIWLEVSFLYPSYSLARMRGTRTKLSGPQGFSVVIFNIHNLQS